MFCLTDLQVLFVSKLKGVFFPEFSFHNSEIFPSFYLMI